MTDEERAPRRLAESSGPAGDALRRALAEQDPSAPLPRFTQLQERRLGRSRRQTAALLAAAAVALSFGVRSLRPHEPAVTVSAEPPTLAPPPSPPSVPSAAPAEEQPALRHVPSKPVPRRELTSKPRVAPASSSSSRGVATAAAPATMPTPAELHGGAKPCAELARSGAVEEAIRCYDALSSGTGVSAELALFEQARLAGKALRQPARALSLLEAYRQRFPNGSLRAEALLAQIEWSLAAGDNARARASVEEALASGLLSERRAELERLSASLRADAPVTESR